MDIKYLIEILPDFLSYFAPGAIAIGLYNILFLKKQDHSVFIFWSIVYSYIIKLVASLVWTDSSNLLCGIVIGVTVPLLLYFVVRVKPFGVDSIFGVTLPENIWLKVLDFEDNNYIVVYLTNGMAYAGTVYTADDDWVILKDYYSIDKTPDDNCKQILCIPSSKIEYFEYSYEDGSPKIKEFIHLTECKTPRTDEVPGVLFMPSWLVVAHHLCL